jgi:glutamate-1-semialdehyde 2,1-aminomutase
MEPVTTTLALAGAGAAALAALPRALARVQLSRAKHPSLTGHARMARRVARLIPRVTYDEANFFACDGAPPEVAARRRAAFFTLAEALAARSPRGLAAAPALEEALSDLRFTAAYRVPFQFSDLVRAHLRTPPFAEQTRGPRVTDIDGNVAYDLSGSYGVNLLGHEFYKGAIARAVARVEDLGPLLGTYHPVVADNVRRLRALSGMDEVSFHMSGTEAVMQAVRLARYHSGRSHLVRFCGAYHGWWGDVQPGVGNPQPARDTYTLRDMDPRSLRVLARRRDIACVLVNPLQALHPNASAPGDGSLIDGSRGAGVDRTAYTAWLKDLRRVCSERGIALILDEVFVGFRLARGGAQEYFGVAADLVTYGKTLGGGLPVGVICGRARWMKRFREDRPADVCFARGTFNSHPYVMGAMAEFLEALETPAVRALYAGLAARWDARAAAFNARLAAEGLPVRVAHLSSIWTVCYRQPSRYHWMLQYYLREAGLALSWVGTGRLVWSFDYSDAEVAEVLERFVAACRAMRDGGWWWAPPGATHRSLRRGVLRELLARRLAA